MTIKELAKKYGPKERINNDYYDDLQEYAWFITNVLNKIDIEIVEQACKEVHADTLVAQSEDTE